MDRKFYGLVCKDCLEANPNNTELLAIKCSQSHQSTTVYVHVALNDVGLLEEIRPLPKKFTPEPGGEFILCKSCFRGTHCTDAHSQAELKAWNAQLVEPLVELKDDRNNQTHSGHQVLQHPASSKIGHCNTPSQTRAEKRKKESIVSKMIMYLKRIFHKESILDSSCRYVSSSNYIKIFNINETSRLDDYKVALPPIGEGGFGVVFQVKHIMDQADYALKMIRLPGIPEKQDKVKEEARALAQLNHPHIVRYYNSWMEKAPNGWREKRIWSELKSSDSVPLYITDNLPTTSTNTRVVSADHEAISHTADLVVSNRDDALSSSGRSQFEIIKSATVQSPDCLFIQIELCQRATLRTWLRQEKSRIKSQILKFFKQILEALVHIHEEGFVHRDLKPSNIFFSCGKSDCLKIGDFGLVRTVAQPNGGVDTTPHASTDGYSIGSVAGTRPYMSPEQVKGTMCDQKSDMFALGIILFELHHYVIMEARNQVLLDLRNLKFPPKFEDNLPNVTKIVKLLLATDPAERPTSDELTKNTFLEELGKETGVVAVL